MDHTKATIEAHGPKGPDDTITIDLDGLTSYAEAVAAIWGEMDPDEENGSDELPEGVTLASPQGFAVHLFAPQRGTQGKGPLEPVPNFDDILKAWSDEKDDDRREAMADYLDNGADDLSDFDEVYQGQHASGAAFAEEHCEGCGVIPRDFPAWVCIDWEATWNCNLRYDYWISDNGHVFRNL